jgi:DNA methyltransferase 1-associated protein 1
LESLFTRNAEEIQEEERLHAELMKFEEKHSKIVKDRQELLSRFYRGLDPQEMCSYNTKRKKIREANLIKGTLLALISISFLFVSSAVYSILVNYSAGPSVEGLTVTSEKLVPGAFLRSAKLAVVKPVLHAKVHGIIQQLGFSSYPNFRLVLFWSMPWRAVQSHFINSFFVVQDHQTALSFLVPLFVNDSKI